MDNFLNLFWAIIWGMVLICVIAGLFGKIFPLALLAVFAAAMLLMFTVEYIKGRRK